MKLRFPRRALAFSFAAVLLAAQSTDQPRYEQREGMRSTLGRTGERLDRYTRVLHEHGLESVDREVRWLTELIEHERSDAANDEK